MFTPTPHPQDDLTVINGIGDALQEWLRQRLHVRTYADLAALSPDDLETDLKADGKIASRRRIERWLEESRQLAEGRTHHEEFAPFASFVIEFSQRHTPEGIERRTRVHHMETDQTTTWPSVESDTLCRWITDQLGAFFPQPVASLSPSLMTHDPAPSTQHSAPSTSPTPPGFSPRLQTLLARAVGSHAEPPPLQHPAPSTSPTPPGFSPELTRHLGQAAALYGAPWR